MRVSALFFLCATLCASLASAQSTGSVQWSSTTRGTGVISGHVASADGNPLPHADVGLSSPVGKRTVVADDQGWFEFVNLAPGDYEVRATVAGYLTTAYGQTLEDRRSKRVRIRNNQVRSNIDLTLPRSGVVIVQVTDERNAPVEGAPVQVTHVSQVFWENGQWRSVSRDTKQRTETTDDRGEIRVIDLGPGDYYVSAAPPGVSRNTFYPGVSRFVEAEPVTLAPGQQLTVGVPVVRPGNAEPSSRLGVITVHVTDESGNPREGVEVRALAVSGEGESRSMTRAALAVSGASDSRPSKEFYTDDNGDARIYGLPGGQYVVVAQPAMAHVVGGGRREREHVFPPTYYPGSPVARDAQPISISSWDEVNLDIRLAPAAAARISGKIVRPDGEPSQSTIVLRWNPDSPLYSDAVSTADVRIVSVDGTFVFPTVPPGDYIIETDDGDLSESEGYASAPVTVVQGEDINDLVLTIVPRLGGR